MVGQAELRDCFICHASEDKDAVAKPLADALIGAGYEVWFDAYEMTVGDSLRERIDQGLAESRFGVVILSEHFFQKDWPQSELNGLFAKEIVGDERLILPVWHGVDEDYLATKSPMLADRIGVSSDPFDAMVEKIVRAIEHRKGTGATAAAILAARRREPGPSLPEPVVLVENRRRVKLVLSEAERASYVQRGGHPSGPGWLSVVAGPVKLQRDLLDPTELKVQDLQQLQIDDAWYRNSVLNNRIGLRVDHEGFYCRFPEDEAEPPDEWLRIWEDGLMEFGRDISRSDRLSQNGEPERIIPTTSVAELVHDYTLLFLTVLRTVGYTSEAAAIVNFGNVEGNQLGVSQRRYFLGDKTVKAKDVLGRTLRGPLDEITDQVGQWTKKTMDRLFLAGGLTMGYAEIDDEGHRLNESGQVIS